MPTKIVRVKSPDKESNHSLAISSTCADLHEYEARKTFFQPIIDTDCTCIGNCQCEPELHLLLLAIQRACMDSADSCSVTARLRHLKACGGTINCRSKRGEFPLLAACAYGHYDVVQLLIEHRADVNKTDEFGVSALIEVAKRGCRCLPGMHCRQLGNRTLRCRTEICRLLLEEKADLTMRMRSLVMEAAIPDQSASRKSHRVRIARASGGLIMMKDELLYSEETSVIGYVSGTSAFLRAVEHGHLAMAELLLQNKANVNATDDLGTTPLILASKIGRQDVLQLLVQNRAHLCTYHCIGRCKEAWHRGIYNSKQLSCGTLARAMGFIDAFNYLHKLGVK